MNADMEWLGSVNKGPGHSSTPTTTTTSTIESLIEPEKMQLIYFSNEFPHDDLKDLLRRLYSYSKDRRYPVLATFIRETTIAIREEVRSLPSALRALVPPFETIFNLVDHADLRKGPLRESVNGVLLCAVQLATLIG
jgi:monodictyphenone polyketide synthase